LKKDSFINILDKKQIIQQVETAELKTVVAEFPYFQAARALYLKGLKNQDSFKYNNELKTTAAYSTDRTILFDFIVSNEFNTDQKENHQQAIENIVEEKAPKSSINIKSIPEKTSVEKIESELHVGKPISFTNAENYSFNQWLQLSTKKPIIREVHEENNSDENQGIIEKFIQNNPKITPLAKDKSVSISIAKNKQDSSLMTETLAKVYLEQKKYENAIQAYRILILKYPEKSGFFADQIKRIQILQKNKS
jgi:tetratricopeptide (TPR) repeat protein